METALNYYGIIPDVPQTITSVTSITTKKFISSLGAFTYSKISRKLFFGYTKIKSTRVEEYFSLAVKEKALLDYIYLRKIKTSADLRFNLSDFNYKRYHLYARMFPDWVSGVSLPK